MTDIASKETPQHPVSWLSLLRTARAPFLILLIAAVGLLLPPQTADMSAALADENLGNLSDTVLFHVALALLSVSAWYWARALIAARFDVTDTRAARQQISERDPRVDSNVFDAVPQAIFFMSVLLGVGLAARSGKWSTLIYIAAWAIPLGLLIIFRLRLGARIMKCFRRSGRQDRDQGPAAEPEEPADGGGADLRSTGDFCLWVRSMPARFMRLIRRAPYADRLSYWPALIFIVISLGLFVYGAFSSFVMSGDTATPSDPLPISVSRHGDDLLSDGLPAIVARWFPGPAAALVGFALMIPPLCVLTFVADGLRLAIRIRGLPLGPTRPPVIGPLLVWVLVAPTLFSLHTVRVVPHPDKSVPPIDRRAPLSEIFEDWAKACAPGDTALPLRPVIVAISGGASRAAVWGARVLQQVERQIGNTDSPNRPAALRSAAFRADRWGPPPIWRCWPR